MPTEEAIDLKKKKKGEIYGAGHYLKIEFDHKMLSFKKRKMAKSMVRATILKLNSTTVGEA